MGGGQANRGQATQAANNANASSQQNLATGSADQGRAQSIYDLFFGGPGGSGKVGTMSGFLDPNSLNVTTPTGAYKLNYEQRVKQTENEGRNAQAGIIRQAANNGLGLSSPAVAEMARRTGLDLANTKGADFTDAVTQQHNEALQNFWGASNVAAGVAGEAGRNAVGATTGAGQTASNVYGTAGQYHASPAASIIGSGLSAGGAVGAAAMCPAEGEHIKTPDGSRPVEELKCGDEISQLGGGFARLKCDPIPHDDVGLIRVLAYDGSTALVGEKHAFLHVGQGYFNANEAELGWQVKTDDGGWSTLRAVQPSGRGRVFDIITEDGAGNRTYCVGGIWSLE